MTSVLRHRRGCRRWNPVGSGDCTLRDDAFIGNQYLARFTSGSRRLLEGYGFRGYRGPISERLLDTSEDARDYLGYVPGPELGLIATIPSSMKATCGMMTPSRSPICRPTPSPEPVKMGDMAIVTGHRVR